MSQWPCHTCILLTSRILHRHKTAFKLIVIIWLMSLCSTHSSPCFCWHSISMRIPVDSVKDWATHVLYFLFNMHLIIIYTTVSVGKMTHQGKIFSVKLLSNVNVNRSTQNYQPSHTLSFLCLSPDTAKIPASLSQWLSLRGGVLSLLAHEKNSFPSNMVL